MKRLMVLLFIVMLALGASGCFGVYFKPYRLEWSPDVSEVKTMSSREWIARPIYYTGEPALPLETLDGYGAGVRFVDKFGQDLPNPVWGPVDPTMGMLIDGPAPSMKSFHARLRGTAMLSASQDGETATVQVVVLPTEILYKDQGLDLDGDGQNDFVIGTVGTEFSFPYGASMVDLFVAPGSLGEVAVDYPAPERTPVSVDNVGSACWIYVCNASDDSVWAVLVRGLTNKTGQIITFRKLRDAA